MVRSFAGKDIVALAASRLPKGFPPDIARTARRKLLMISAAAELSDLLAPPGNRLEALSGDRLGQHSIRINDQWRICFRWQGGRAVNIEITDYH